MKLTRRLCALFSLLCIGLAVARSRDRYEEPVEYYVENVKTMDRLDEIIKKNDLVIAYVYSMTDRDSQPVPSGYESNKLVHTERWDFVNSNYDLIQQHVIDNEDHYDAAGEVKFIAINFERGDMANAKKRFGLEGQDSLVFLQDGEIKKKQRLEMRLTNRSLQNFFDTVNFDDFVDDYIAKQRRIDEKNRRRRRAYRSYYGGPYIGFGYRSYYPYDRPYWGYYGYPYYRGYYRPSFGFSFGW